MEQTAIIKRDLTAPSARAILQDINVSISWGDIARRYFTKSAPWFYQRLNGIDGNGNPTAFTLEEKEQLRNALLNLADRIRNSAALL